MDQKIIGATQCGVVRIKETTSGIDGLCTKGLKVCVAVVIVGNVKNDKRRISLSHIDATTDLNAFLFMRKFFEKINH